MSPNWSGMGLMHARQYITLRSNVYDLEAPGWGGAIPFTLASLARVLEQAQFACCMALTMKASKNRVGRQLFSERKTLRAMSEIIAFTSEAIRPG